MKSIASLPLSTSQRIVTVEVGTGEERRWLVLGITPSSITTLHTMAAQATLEAAPSGIAGEAHPAFAQILGRFRRPGTGADPDAR
jgi:flagellar protein FliO/FliZ